MPSEAQIEAKARELCFAICSEGGFLDYENGCCSTCKSEDKCQGWRAFAYNARAALSAAEQHADGWRDMSSVPTDGTEFQAWCVRRDNSDDGFWEPRCRYCTLSGSFEIWGRVDYDQEGWDTYDAVVATHWRPLPAPPAKGGCEMSDWIEWKGGECPVADDAIVEVRFRNGTTSSDGDVASVWYWRHDYDPSDIIAYRIITKGAQDVG